jgi:N-methylhydantoinase A/oxoprolinase/acetone carboxylase beta subunit
VEGISVSFPLTEIVSAGAGGSSIFRVVDGHITIGPDSVGAVPGPACFGRGGREATITDASLLAGLFDPKSYFGGSMTLDAERAAAAINANVAGPLGISLDGALQRMERAYEEKIAAELHRVTRISKDTVMLAFGGAGPLNACGVAEKAGISTVVVPQMAAVFSAYGIGACDISQRYSLTLDGASDDSLALALGELKAKAARDMYAEGVEDGDYRIETRLVADFGEGGETVHELENELRVPGALKGAKVLELELAAIKSLRSGSERRASFVEARAARSGGMRNILVAGKGRVDVPVYTLAQIGRASCRERVS